MIVTNQGPVGPTATTMAEGIEAAGSYLLAARIGHVSTEAATATVRILLDDAGEQTEVWSATIVGVVDLLIAEISLPTTGLYLLEASSSILDASDGVSLVAISLLPSDSLLPAPPPVAPTARDPNQWEDLLGPDILIVDTVQEDYL